MTKTDRLLAIVLELQSKRRQRAEDLAETFETSKRTIYRDIQALCEAGVPIVSIPGQGYSLMQGYFLPPLSFSTEEATMLLLGSDFMAQNFDAQYQLAAQGAYRKISAVLPENLKVEVEYLQNSIRFIAAGTPESRVEKQRLQELRRAIIEHRRVHFSYYSRSRNTEQLQELERDVDPYGLVYLTGIWHLTGYCHLRQDIRNFRLDRMEELELLETYFQRPDTFKLQANHNHSNNRNTIVKALFDPGISRWAKESRSYYVIAEEECDEGLLVTLAVRQESEVIQWLLSWGSKVRVLEPASLRDKIRAEAVAMYRHYQRRSNEEA